MILLAIVAVLFMQLGCMPPDDRHHLYMNFLPEEYTLKISNKTHRTTDDTTAFALFAFSGEEVWNITASCRECCERILLELIKRTHTHQNNLFEVSYNSDIHTGAEIPYTIETHERVCKESLSPILLSSLAGPKVGTKLKASFLNSFREIGNITVITQGHPSDSFGDRYFDSTFDVINNIHALLPEKRVKIGDSWQRPIMKPLALEATIARKSHALNAVVTFEKIEKSDRDDTVFAVLKIEIDTYRNRLDFGGPFPMRYDDVVVFSEGKLVINTSNGLPVSYTAQTEMRYVAWGRSHKIQEEFAYEFTFVSDMFEIP